MKRTFWAAGAALALGLAACDLGDRPRPAPTPTPTAPPAPGTNWQPLGSPPPFEVAALQFVNPQVAWAVGANNVVRTEDAGATWAAPRAMPSVGIPTLSSWSSVSFVDPRFGFVGGTYGLFKTEDGGTTWTGVAPFLHDNNGPPPHTLNALVRFRDYEHGVVVWLGELHRTTDGGKTWTKAPLGPGAFRALGTIGTEFAVLTDAHLWKSKPDGTWGEVLLPTAFREGMHNPAYGAFHFLDDKNGWVFQDGTLHRTADGGTKWTALEPPDHRGGEGSVVRFLDPARGWVIGKGYFKATRTGGATWEEVPHRQNFHQDRDRSRDIQVLDAANVYVYGGTWGLRRWVAP